jgi:DNA topoisomerase VI subunit B
LNNALKFTSEGCIEIEAAVGRRKGRASLEFAVRDSGIGMSEAEMKRIFKPFAQADASTTRKYGGTGLGLMIVKDLLVNMGGDIEVESQPGKGSRFAFWMPLVEAQEAEPEIRQNTAFVNPKMVKVKVSEAEENWLKEAMGEVASPVPGATDDISDLLAYAAKKLKGDGA